MMRMAQVLAICLGVSLLTPAGASSAQAGGQVLTASDVVAIRVVGQPDLDIKAHVAPDGTINFPYVGRIKAAGLTEDELARAVERRLVEL
jgi:protein involved in polysaccharide export with SLBB domain